MNVITIMNDTFRRDHVGAYGLEAPWVQSGDRPWAHSYAEPGRSRPPVRALRPLLRRFLPNHPHALRPVDRPHRVPDSTLATAGA